MNFLYRGLIHKYITIFDRIHWFTIVSAAAAIDDHVDFYDDVSDNGNDDNNINNGDGGGNAYSDVAVNLDRGNNDTFAGGHCDAFGDGRIQTETEGNYFDVT